MPHSFLRHTKNNTYLQQNFSRIDELWGAKRNTENGDELDEIMLLVEKYEEEHYPNPPSDLVEAIKFLMGQKSLTRKDIEPYSGTMACVSEVLNRKRNLRLPMIKKLHEGLNIPYNCLIT
jgi:HTH-type transcriptional regulator / antitoxin HigA